MRTKTAETAPATPAAAGTGEGAIAQVSTEGKALAPAELSSMLSRGETSDFSRDDLAVPFVRIIQALSPQVQPGDSKFIKGATQGMILETVSPLVFDGDAGVIVVPVMYRREYSEFKPNRGGFVRSYGSDPAILNSVQVFEQDRGDGNVKRINRLPNGNEVEESAWYYVLYSPDEKTPFEQAVLAMGGTQWKTSREWNRNTERVRINGPDGQPIRNPALFAFSWRFRTIPMKKGNYNFFGWKVDPYKPTLELPEGLGLIRHAADFRRKAQEGRVQVVPDDAAPSADDDPF